jgi:glutamine synthetase
LADYDSYFRIGVEGTCSWIGYGTENRDLPVRKISDRHWELRCVDATAKMYMFLAALLSAGSHGTDKVQALTWKDLAEFHFDMAPEKLGEYGL